jgi:hypothetical protein
VANPAARSSRNYRLSAGAAEKTGSQNPNLRWILALPVSRIRADYLQSCCGVIESNTLNRVAHHTNHLELIPSCIRVGSMLQPRRESMMRWCFKLRGLLAALRFSLISVYCSWMIWSQSCLVHEAERVVRYSRCFQACNTAKRTEQLGVFVNKLAVARIFRGDRCTQVLNYPQPITCKTRICTT